MRFILTGAVAATLLATPAYAGDGDFYVGGELGVIFAAGSDLVFTPAETAGSTGRVDLDTKAGYDFGLFAGYDLGPVRLEAEASRRSAGASDFDSDFALGNGGTVSLGKQNAAGRVKVQSFMGNAMVDIGDDAGLSFFIGGGAGYAKIDYTNIRRDGTAADLLEDGDWRFAWQALAGARMPVSSAVDVTLRYRLFNADGKSNLVGLGGRGVDDRFRSHSLMVGATFNF